MSARFTTSCQPPSFLRSRVSFITTTTTSGHFHLGVAPIHTVQTRGWHFYRELKSILQQYRSSPRALRGISFPPKNEIIIPSAASRNIRLLSEAVMPPRRSARLIAASETVTPPPPPPAPAQRGRKRKAEAEAETVPDGATKEAPVKAPTTSKKRRAQRTSTPPPPPTPTPSNVKLMAEPAAAPGDAVYATPPSKKPRAAAVDRLAGSNTTLGTLLSPETSRIVTSKKARTRSPSASPTKQPVQKAAATTNILEEANQFLISVDPRMRPLVENHHCRIFSPEGLAEEIDPFESLCSGIISQQVSVRIKISRA